MAYVNVKDWSVDQVTDWLKGKLKMFLLRKKKRGKFTRESFSF